MGGSKLDTIQIELTNKCPYSCLLCPHGSGQLTRPKGYMDMDLLKQLLKESYRISSSINFSFFGEPTIHPNFHEIMEILEGRPANFQIYLNTNMAMVTTEIMDSIVRGRIDNLRVGIDASTEDVYNIVKPAGSPVDLDGSIRNTGRLSIINGKLIFWFNKTDHVPTRHVYTVSSHNTEDMKGYADRWLPLLGTRDTLLFKNVLTYGGKITDPFTKKGKCNIPDRTLTVSWDGFVSPCNLDTNMNLAVGNITNTSMASLLASPKYNEIIGQIKERAVFPCNTCVDSNYWDNNVTLKRGDRWRDDIRTLYR